MQMAKGLMVSPDGSLFLPQPHPPLHAASIPALRLKPAGHILYQSEENGDNSIVGGTQVSPGPSVSALQ